MCSLGIRCHIIFFWRAIDGCTIGKSTNWNEEDHQHQVTYNNSNKYNQTRYIEETDRCLTHIIHTRQHQQLQSHVKEEEEEEAHCCCDGILIEEDYSVGAYYLGDDIDCCLTSSSLSSFPSSSSSIYYQQEFVDSEEQKVAHSIGATMITMIYIIIMKKEIVTVCSVRSRIMIRYVTRQR